VHSRFSRTCRSSLISDLSLPDADLPQLVEVGLGMVTISSFSCCVGPSPRPCSNSSFLDSRNSRRPFFRGIYSVIILEKSGSLPSKFFSLSPPLERLTFQTPCPNFVSILAQMRVKLFFLQEFPLFRTIRKERHPTSHPGCFLSPLSLNCISESFFFLTPPPSPLLRTLFRFWLLLSPSLFNHDAWSISPNFHSPYM